MNDASTQTDSSGLSRREAARLLLAAEIKFASGLFGLHPQRKH